MSDMPSLEKLFPQFPPEKIKEWSMKFADESRTLEWGSEDAWRLRLASTALHMVYVARKKSELFMNFAKENP